MLDGEVILIADVNARTVLLGILGAAIYDAIKWVVRSAEPQNRTGATVPPSDITGP